MSSQMQDSKNLICQSAILRKAHHNLVSPNAVCARQTNLCDIGRYAPLFGRKRPLRSVWDRENLSGSRSKNCQIENCTESEEVDGRSQSKHKSPNFAGC